VVARHFRDDERGPALTHLAPGDGQEFSCPHAVDPW
jgi:hypothetical protein